MKRAKALEKIAKDISTCKHDWNLQWQFGREGIFCMKCKCFMESTPMNLYAAVTQLQKLRSGKEDLP